MADHEGLEARAPRVTATHTRHGSPIKTPRAEIEARGLKPTASLRTTRHGSPIHTPRAEIEAREPRPTGSLTRHVSPVRTRRAYLEDEELRAQATGVPVVDHQEFELAARSATRKHNIGQSLQGINDVVAQANAVSGRVADLIQ